MNTPGDKQFPETPADKIHKEEYENRVVFNIREQRLEELGYTRVLTVASSSTGQPSATEKQIEEASETLIQHGREVAILTYGKITKLYQRAPGSSLPTAKEDFDSPAGEDAVIAYAVACVRTGMKKNLN